MLGVLSQAKFSIFGAVIDKRTLTAQYARPFDPYHVALSFILQRYCGYLSRFGGMGDVVAESRQKREDGQLQAAFSRVLEHGDAFGQCPAAFYRDVLTVRKAMFRQKHENVAGLQLADLLAHPLRRWVLLHTGRTAAAASAFESRIFEVVTSKFNHRLGDGLVEGYGWRLFPLGPA